ncbi:MAG: hypothetical protein AAGA48_18995 [Myxococcota bacterium]
MSADRLYERLPAVVRSRDGHVGYPLRALFRVLQTQADAYDADLKRLYDNLFIETCEEWAVPYIGDLVDALPIRPVPARTHSRRSWVGQTIQRRRRKGTPGVVEHLALAASGFESRAVEYLAVVATTENVNLHRMAAQLPHLALLDPFERHNGPFDELPRTPDVRRIPNRVGRHNLPNVGVWLWRETRIGVAPHSARRASVGVANFFVHPLGVAAPLFNVPTDERSLASLATERERPGVLRHWPLHVGQTTSEASWLEGNRAAVRVFLVRGGPPERVPPSDIALCSLDDDRWAGTFVAPSGARVALDPVRGRLTVLDDPGSVVEVHVEAQHGVAGAIGAGTAGPPSNVADNTLAELPETWATGVVNLTSCLEQQPSSGTWTLTVPAGETLIVQANGIGVRPHLRGTLEIVGGGGRVVLRGLLIEGTVRVASDAVSDLTIEHCTITGADPEPALHLSGPTIAEGATATLSVTVKRSMVGPVVAQRANPEPGPDGIVLRIEDSSVDARPLPPDSNSRHNEAALLTPDSQLELFGVTVLGQTRGRRLEASDVIFGGDLRILQTQRGCMRHCVLWLSGPSTDPYVGTRTPRRHRCIPDQALDDVSGPSAVAFTITRLRPRFVSLQFGQPGYARLHPKAAVELREGGADGAEPGAFAFEQEAIRLRNLRDVLPAYLPFGMEAGIFDATGRHAT